jgi:hypothetical protein
VVAVQQWAIYAVSLDSGAIVARQRRVFAGGLTFTDPAHQAALDELRSERRRPYQPTVETRPLARPAWLGCPRRLARPRMAEHQPSPAIVERAQSKQSKSC